RSSSSVTNFPNPTEARSSGANCAGIEPGGSGDWIVPAQRAALQAPAGTRTSVLHPTKRHLSGVYSRNAPRPRGAWFRPFLSSRHPESVHVHPPVLVLWCRFVPGAPRARRRRGGRLVLHARQPAPALPSLLLRAAAQRA